MTKKIVKRTDANNETLYFYTHSDAVDVGEGSSMKSLTEVIDDTLHKSPQTLTNAEKTQVYANLGLNGVDDIPTDNSNNIVRSGGVKAAIDDVIDDFTNRGFMYKGIAPASAPLGEDKTFYIAKSGDYSAYTGIGDGSFTLNGIAVLTYAVGTASGAWTKNDIVLFDEEPTANSNNLVKSGGVEKKLPFCMMVGKNNTEVFSSWYSNVIKGHIYRIHISNPTIEINNVSYTSPAVFRFRISGKNTDETTSNLLVIGMDTYQEQSIEPYYNIYIPSNIDAIRFAMYANRGEKQCVVIEDITSHYDDICELKSLEYNLDNSAIHKLSTYEFRGYINTERITSDNQRVHFCRVKAGQKVKIHVSSNGGRVAYTRTLPQLGTTYINGFTHYASDSALANAEFISDIDAYLCLSHASGIDTYFYIQNTDGLSATVQKLSNEMPILQNNVEILQTDMKSIQRELSMDDYFVEDIITRNNIIPLNSSYQTNTNFCTDYIYIKANTHVKVVQGVGWYAGFSIDKPSRGVTLVFSKAFATSDSLHQYDFIFEEDGYLGVGREKDTAENVFHIINNGLAKKVDSLIPSSFDVSVLLPKYIYHSYNIGNHYRNIMQSVKIEGLLNKRLKSAKINNGRELPVCYYDSEMSSNTAKEDIDITVSSNGTKVVSSTFKQVTTKNSVIIGKTIKHLAIGDSWTAANSKALDGESIGAWGYVSAAIEEFIKSENDLNDNSARFISMGRVAIKRRDVEYNGNRYNIRASDEGFGGWSACSFLRFPFSIRTGNAGTMSEKLAWDALGLGRKQLYGSTYNESAPYTAFVNDVEHKVQYLTEVAMGYYHWDYSTELLRWAEGGSSQSVYVSGNTSQQQTIDAAMENALNNPENPFYDWETAISSNGEYAFSLAKYLERYKTLADDGVTRLVIGETAGTKITQPYQLTDYDICEPSHVTVELGMNDYTGLTAQQRVDDIIQLCNLIRLFDSNIKIGIITVHHTGLFYPEDWVDRIVSKGISDKAIYLYYSSESSLVNVNRIISEMFVSENGLNGIYYIPSYHIQGNTKLGAKLGLKSNGEPIIIDGYDIIHPSIDVYKEMGQQLWAWLLYTLT